VSLFKKQYISKYIIIIIIILYHIKLSLQNV